MSSLFAVIAALFAVSLTEGFFNSFLISNMYIVTWLGSFRYARFDFSLSNQLCLVTRSWPRPISPTCLRSFSPVLYQMIFGSPTYTFSFRLSLHRHPAFWQCVESSSINSIKSNLITDRSHACFRYGLYVLRSPYSTIYYLILEITIFFGIWYGIYPANSLLCYFLEPQLKQHCGLLKKVYRNSSPHLDIICSRWISSSEFRFFKSICFKSMDE